MIAFWPAVRWPLLVLAIAAVAIGVATVLDRTASSEWALTIGGLPWSAETGGGALGSLGAGEEGGVSTALNLTFSRC